MGPLYISTMAKIIPMLLFYEDRFDIKKLMDLR